MLIKIENNRTLTTVIFLDDKVLVVEVQNKQNNITITKRKGKTSA